MKEIRYSTLLGHQGKIEGFLSTSCPSYIKTISHLGPLIESQTFSPPHFSFKVPETCSDEFQYLLEKTANWYKKQKKYGPFGDILRYSRFQVSNTVIYKLDVYGQVAFKKPALAVDLALFLRNKQGEVFTVGITRKEKPGQGKLALVGGFRDIQGYHLQTGLEAIIAEAKQEIGITIEPNFGYKKKVSTDLYCKSLPVTIKFRRRLSHHPASLFLIGSFASPDTEKISGLHQKRVHETVAYGLLLDIKSLNQADLSIYFKAGDDAKEVVIQKVEKTHFFLAHHQEIFKAAKLRLGL